jgi:hypothetical protein
LPAYAFRHWRTDAPILAAVRIALKMLMATQQDTQSRLMKSDCDLVEARDATFLRAPIHGRLERYRTSDRSKVCDAVANFPTTTVMLSACKPTNPPNAGTPATHQERACANLRDGMSVKLDTERTERLLRRKVRRNNPLRGPSSGRLTTFVLYIRLL